MRRKAAAEKEFQAPMFLLFRRPQSLVQKIKNRPYDWLKFPLLAKPARSTQLHGSLRLCRTPLR
jgi:hypothetical protein